MVTLNSRANLKSALSGSSGENYTMSSRDRSGNLSSGQRVSGLVPCRLHFQDLTVHSAQWLERHRDPHRYDATVGSRGGGLQAGTFFVTGRVLVCEG